MSYETKWNAFFGAKLRCLFLPRSRSPAKAMRYADETLLFQDIWVALKKAVLD